jgi:hypothetical protein
MSAHDEVQPLAVKIEAERILYHLSWAEARQLRVFSRADRASDWKRGNATTRRNVRGPVPPVHAWTARAPGMLQRPCVGISSGRCSSAVGKNPRGTWTRSAKLLRLARARRSPEPGARPPPRSRHMRRKDVANLKSTPRSVRARGPQNFWWTTRRACPNPGISAPLRERLSRCRLRH